MSSSLSTIDPLGAVQAIQHLRARYCLCVDGKRWDELRRLFSPDATTETGGQRRWRSRDEFVDKVAAIFATAVTLHSVATPLITLHTATTASGVWTMEDRLWFADDSEPSGWRHWQGSGRYHEDYVRVDGRWFIQRLRLERVDPIAPATR